MTAGRDENERGAALILALIVASLFAALGLSVVAVADTERRMAANDRYSIGALYAARSAVQRTIADLAPMPQWDDVLSGRVQSTFTDGSQRPTAASGEVLDLPALTADLQNDSNAAGTFGANTPVWRLFGWGTFSSMTGGTRLDAPEYVVVWVADDAADQDGNASADSNGVVTVHADAYGLGGARRIVEATVARVASGIVRVISWRELH